MYTSSLCATKNACAASFSESAASAGGSYPVLPSPSMRLPGYWPSSYHHCLSAWSSVDPPPCSRAVRQRHPGSDVRVSRVFDDDSSADPVNAAATDPAPNAGRVNGYVWAVTFLTDVGDLPPLVANAFGLRLSSAMDDNRGASAPYLQVVEQYKGVVPHNHTNVTVAGDATEVTMLSLTTGAEYGFRVTALTDQGAGAASRVAAGVPAEEPSELRTLVKLSRHTQDLLRVQYAQDADANGDAVTAYVVESSQSAAFPNGSTLVQEYAVDYTVQRIETDAHTRPFTAGAQFSLSVGDFEGSWVLFDEAETKWWGRGRDAPNRTLVNVDHGGSVVTRSRPAPGLDERLDLSKYFARGDYLRVGGQAFSVCVESDLVEHNVTGGGKQSLSYPTEALKTDSTVDTYYYAAYGPKTLPLCRADDPWTPAYYDGGPRGDDLRQAPLYKLDTSLSGAVGPAIGDAALAPRRGNRGGDASIDWRAYGLKRGDYIRVGHPRTGETFRVSTDPAKEFSDTTVPLAQADDAMLEAGLTAQALRHAAYEVQEVRIYCDAMQPALGAGFPEHCNLTAGSVSASGFRLKFGDETTAATEAGGEPGCMVWDDDATAIEAELETLVGIDDVEVTRMEMKKEYGDDYWGVRYLVTFVGDLVRGDVPELAVVSLGRDGCHDAEAEDASYVFGTNATGSVQTLQTSTVPVWRAQTTAPLPWDAEADDVKYALEALQQVCTVDVERVVETGSNGYAWYVTFTAELESRDDTRFMFSPLLGLGANEDGLEAAIQPTVTVTPVAEKLVPAPSGGGPTYVRVAARNDFGVGAYRTTSPVGLTPQTQKPDPPALVRAEVVSPTELLVEWVGPENDGGAPVTSFEVEYDPAPTFDSGAQGHAAGSVRVFASDRRGVADVQSVTVAETTGERYLGGFFALSFDGQDTQALPYDASAAAVELAPPRLAQRYLTNSHPSPWPHAMQPAAV